MTCTIFDLIENEHKRQSLGLELIASENFVSSDVLYALGSVLTNKYAEGYPGRRYYGGCEIVDMVEKKAIEGGKKLFNAEWVNVQPHSGSQANAAVMLGVLNPGDKILGFNLAHGGHLTHGSPVSFSGKLYDAVFYSVDRDTETINMDEVEKIAHKERPKLIICGASAYSREWDFRRFREIADSVGALLMGDVAHIAGLIVTKQCNDPIDYCHFLTTTTHKTLRGPRGGMIIIGKDFENPMGKKSSKGKLLMMSEILDAAVFPGTQGGPLMHVIAAKAVAFQEALHPDFIHYISQVKKNAKALEKCLKQFGYRIVSGITENHLLLIDLTNKNISGKKAASTLELAGITVNKNMIPFDKTSPFITSGIRIGTSAITTRGLNETDMEFVAKQIDNALSYKDNKAQLNTIKEKINTWMYDYPLPSKYVPREYIYNYI